MHALLIALLILASVPALHARPIFVVMNSADPSSAPAKFGYVVTHLEQEGTVQFSIKLDSNASSKFHKATVFFHTYVDGRPEIPVKSTKDDTGCISLTFSLPKPLLRSCVLQIDSEFLREDDLISNFAGYRLRLDNLSDLNDQSGKGREGQIQKAEQGVPPNGR